MTEDYTWVDCRWQKEGWLPVFRVRLCGWLPRKLAMEAIENELLHQEIRSGQDELMLTSKAISLTGMENELASSHGNCIMLANVLVAKGFERSWLAKPRPGRDFRLKDDQIFPQSFREDIIKIISTL